MAKKTFTKQTSTTTEGNDDEAIDAADDIEELLLAELTTKLLFLEKENIQQFTMLIEEHQ